MNSKYDFYEIVRVLPTVRGEKFQWLIGKEGVVLGKAQSDSGEWVYSVFTGPFAYTFEEDELEFTGKKDDPKLHSSGLSIRVTQDGKIVDVFKDQWKGGGKASGTSDD